jgi:hypothetical protein
MGCRWFIWHFCRLRKCNMAILLSSGFEILYLSDPRYEESNVEIQYKGQQVALLIKDKGVDKIEMEIYSQYVLPDFVSELKFPLLDFLEAIEEAKIALCCDDNSTE